MGLTKQDMALIDKTAELAATKAVDKIEPRIESLENWRAYTLGAIALASVVIGIALHFFGD